MSLITESSKRKIIDDFAKAIEVAKIETDETAVIQFRDGQKMDIYKVPTSLLRYRLENGRISSDVQDHQTQNAPLLKEDENETQSIIEKFLKEKDEPKTKQLKQSIYHRGQENPAIITCDGFVVNGNRRLLTIKELKKDNASDQFEYMKCAILPGENDSGGPPSLIEIAKLENRYQLQQDGRSDYDHFDQAISIRDNIEVGLSLEEQLKDNSEHSSKSTKDFDKVVKKYQKEYLLPLECVDEYLEYLECPRHYKLISQRWQAFVDYSTHVNAHLSDDKKRAAKKIDEDEIGDIKSAAFNVIRLRAIPDKPKLHDIMRKFLKLCENPSGKDAIKDIADDIVNPSSNGEFETHGEEIQNKWISDNKTKIVTKIHQAWEYMDDAKTEKEVKTLVKAAYEKLTHNSINASTLKAIPPEEHQEIKSILNSIHERCSELDNTLYGYKSGKGRLGDNKSRKKP